MQPETTIKTTWRPICPDLSELLHGSGNEYPARQAKSGCNAVRDRAIREPWPGADIGIRAPEDGETRLSYNEVHFALIKGIV